MDSLKSFKGYGMVDEPEEKSYQKKTRKRIIVASLSSIILLTIIIGTVAGALVNKNKENSRKNPVSSSTAAELKSVCGVTEHHDSCFSSISELNTANSTDPERIFILSLRVAKHSVNKLSALPQEWMSSTDDPFVKKAIEVCRVVFDDALDKISHSISLTDGKDGDGILSVPKINDLKTWLSAIITDQETCLDSLEEVKAPILEEVKHTMKNSTEYASNSLAIVSKIFGILGDLGIPLHRKLLDVKNPEVFPDWISKNANKRLLQEVKPKPNVTVAHDGSGDVRTLKEAFKMVEPKSETRFIVHIKAGKYVENVVLDKSFWNIMIYGDGKMITIISGSLSFADNITTFDTATFAISGRGFIARDIGFENTAGPEKHQAVALRSGSDLSVFYRCSFNAFQDTLYAHSNRQFYRECDITGTIDFIFGNAAVVFQDCNIQPRQPLPKQFVTITAQGKKDPNQNTGISIQNCTMSPLDGNLTAPTYLGRPWKPYSTTIIMQTEIGDFLNPGGWAEWDSGVEPPSSIFYAEYENSGAGANVGHRVKWPGYKSMLTETEASKFTVKSFIQGDNWLLETGVIFDKGL